MKPLNEKFIELRKEKGWSLREVAKQIPISHTAYAKFETGETDPTWPQILRIAKMYKISPMELVHHEIVTLRGLEQQHKIDDIYDVLIAINEELQDIKKVVANLKSEITDLKKVIENLKKLSEKKKK